MMKVEHYSSTRVPNPNRVGDFPWQVFQSVRNDVIRCCRKFGRVGPLGECAIDNGESPDLNRWQAGDAKPLDFYLIDDQYNDERYIYFESVRAGAFTEAVFYALAETLAKHDGWGIGITGLPKGYLLIFADRMMVTGQLFENCVGVNDIADRLAPH